MKILIVKLGALGDVINTLPLAIQLQRQFKARIYWLVAPLSYPIVSEHRSVHKALLFDKKRWHSSGAQVLKHLRGYQFDIVLDLQRTLKSGFFTMAARGNRRIGFDKKRCKEMTWLFPFERIPPSDTQAHMVHQYMEFSSYLGLKNPLVRWELNPPDLPLEKLPDKYVVLNIGATKPANKWTVEGFASLAGAIKQKFDLPCVLTGGKEDQAMAEQIIFASEQEVNNLVGLTSLKQLTSVLSAAEIVVTCDTGPMHLAVALDRPVVALFGPSDHRRTGPFRGKVIRKQISCAPCNRKTCKDPMCMTAIHCNEVMQLLSGCLGGRLGK